MQKALSRNGIERTVFIGRCQTTGRICQKIESGGDGEADNMDSEAERNWEAEERILSWIGS